MPRSMKDSEIFDYSYKKKITEMKNKIPLLHSSRLDHLIKFNT